MKFISALIILLSFSINSFASSKDNYFLMRGLIRETRHWGIFPEILQKTIPQANIVMLEIPGVGKYVKVKTPTSIDDIVEFMRKDFLQEKAKNPNAKNYIIAMSLGAMIATHWMQKYPHDFDKAMLSNTSYKGFCSLFERLRPSNYTTIFKSILANLFGGNKLEQEKYIVSMVSNRPENYERISKNWAKIQEDSPVPVMNLFRQLIAAVIFSPSPAKPQTPLMLLNSTTDRFVSTECSKNIHEKWQVPIKYHATAGHEMALDEPQWLADRVKEWFLPSSDSVVLPTDGQKGNGVQSSI